MAAPDLLEDAVARMAVVTDLRDGRAELLDRERGLRVDIDALAVEQQALRIPEAPPMTEAPRQLEDAQALADRWSARREAQAQLETLLTGRMALLEEHRTVALRLAHESDLIRQALRDAGPFLEEVADRIADGEIAAEEDLAVADGLAVRLTPAGLASDIEDWRAAAGRSELEMSRAERALDAVAAAVAAEETEISRAERWLQEATVRNAVREEWAAQPAGDLMAAFNSRVVDFETLFAELQQRLRDADRLAASVAEAEETIAGLFEPEPPEEAAEGSIVASLDRARRNVALAETVVTYYESKHAGLEALQERLIAAVEADQALSDRLEPAVAEGMQLDVLAELLQEQAADRPLPDRVTDADFAEQLQTLRDARARLAERAAAFSARIDEVVEEVAAARNALVQARAAVRDRNRALQREESWATYIADLREIDSAELIDTFTETNAGFQDLNDELRQLGRSANAAREAAADADEAYTAHVDPAILAMRDRTEAFEQYLADQGLRLQPAPEAEAAAEPAEEAAAEPAAQPAAGEPAAAPTADAAGEGTAPAAEPAAPAPTQAEVWLDDLRHDRDEIAVRRKNFYAEEQALRADLVAALSALEQSLQTYVAAGETVLDTARRAWGAANVLDLRLRREEIAAADMPAGVENWATREVLETITDEVEAIRRELGQVEQRLEALRAVTDRQTLIEPLESWEESLGIRIEELSDYRNLATQFAAIDDPEALDALERQMMERQIRDRIAADLGVYDMLDDFFANAETETIDELLHRYYERLVRNENKLENIEDRQRLIAALIEQSQAGREPLDALREALQPILSDAELALDIETVRVQAALNPADVPELLAGLSERTAIDLDPATIPSLPRGEDEETVRTARNDLIMSLRDDWARLAGYRQWVNELQGATEPLGGIDQFVGELEGLNARLDATRADIERSVGRLVGFSPQELQSLLTVQTDLGPQDRRRLAAGEIGTLREQREGLLESSAIASIVTLLAIPVVAFLLILLIRRLGRRMVNRATGEGGGAAGYASANPQRANTIFGIFNAVFTALIIALAAIYMLQVVNIDVTPIIASLGVFGLAVAFGAQAIMKDVFSGFFLLFENQLNKGDWVEINGLVAEVEGINLRLTLLRDWSTGQLHYVPNGTIQHVSNWSRGWSRLRIDMWTGYDADPADVIGILNTVAEDLKADENFGPYIKNIKVHPALNGIDVDTRTQNFLIFIDVIEERFVIGRHFRQRAKKALTEAGIVLPISQHAIRVVEMPQRDPTAMVTSTGGQ
ncbi:MAG: mechanosensitive ion channel [Alphaproteobacteria bacterium]|nr:mechanosensitive ion channel [Alphaproteobacteria bacterium]